MKIFQKDYDGESVVDSFRDFSEAMDGRFNDALKSVPSDENGFSKGTFTVKIEWNPEGGIQ